jgi:hypothetical protein
MPGPAALLPQINKQEQEKNTQINKKETGQKICPAPLPIPPPGKGRNPYRHISPDL